MLNTDTVLNIGIEIKRGNKVEALVHEFIALELNKIQSREHILSALC